MDEFIPFTPEEETTEERFAWAEILRALHTLSEMDDSFGLLETIQDLREETLEDALNLVFSYVVAVEVPEDESSELDDVIRLLQENGMMEGWGEEDEV